MARHPIILTGVVKLSDDFREQAGGFGCNARVRHCKTSVWAVSATKNGLCKGFRHSVSALKSVAYDGITPSAFILRAVGARRELLQFRQDALGVGSQLGSEIQVECPFEGLFAFGGGLQAVLGHAEIIEEFSVITAGLKTLF